MLLSPSASRTPTVARIWYSDRSILCSFKEHDEQFRKQVKTLGLEWSEGPRAWQRDLNPELNGSPVDRAAELAAKLINAGFVVDVDDTISQAVRSATWQPEQKRWVKAGVKDHKFHLRWRDKDENLYWRAKMLPDAEYDPESRSVAVPMLYFSEVLGFAEEHDFQFTQAAKELLETARREYQRVILPEAPAPKVQKKKASPRVYNLQKFADLPDHHLTVRTELYPHQVPAVEKIMPVRVGGLFMDMGTGKTRCAIELAYRRQARISRVVWFCPVGLKTTIAAEIEKHSAGTQVHVFDEHTTEENLPEAFWYVVGIESISSSDRIVLAVNRLIDPDSFVIVDESTYIKGHASKRSMRIAELSARSRYRLLLTGTPLTQGVEDLYAQVRFLSPEILGYNSFYSFAHNHLEYSEKFPGLIVRAHHVGQLADEIAPFVYQVTKEECLDLPKKLYDRFYFSLTEEQHNAYQQAKDEILTGLLEEMPDYIIFQLFTALQQIVSGFWNRNGKEFIRLPHKRIETLQTAIAGIPENEKVIIWCKYVESLHQISETLPECALYYGELNERERDEQLECFRRNARFLLATQATGGHGLTLNEAHYHIFYENEFKYSHRIQAEDRSHRIGQTEHVTYIDIVSNSGIDRRIQQAIEKKENVVKAFRNEVAKRKGVLEL